MIQAAVLTISDSSFQGLREDCSGPAVRARLELLGWRVAAMEVLPDERETIAERLATLADGGQFAAVFTTGGTGVTERDVTPEATRMVIDREIPGLAETMRMEGRKFTPLAVLSRGIAGTRNRVLLVNLPGSPKGAVESLNAIAGLVPHILDLLKGITEHADPVQRELAG